MRRHQFLLIFELAAIFLTWISCKNHKRKKYAQDQDKTEKTKNRVFILFWATFSSPKSGLSKRSVRLCTGRSRCRYKQKREGETKREIDTQKELVVAKKGTQIMGRARPCLSLHQVSLWRKSGWCNGTFKKVLQLVPLTALLALFGGAHLSNQAQSRATSRETYFYFLAHFQKCTILAHFWKCAKWVKIGGAVSTFPLLRVCNRNKKKNKLPDLAAIATEKKDGFCYFSILALLWLKKVSTSNVKITVWYFLLFFYPCPLVIEKSFKIKCKITVCFDFLY